MEIYCVGNDYIDEETVQKETKKILDILKKEKRTYSMNIFLLKQTIQLLENEVKKIANAKTFQ